MSLFVKYDYEYSGKYIFSGFMIGGDCSENFLEILSQNSHEMSAEPILFTRYCPGVCYLT